MGKVFSIHSFNFPVSTNLYLTRVRYILYHEPPSHVSIFPSISPTNQNRPNLPFPSTQTNTPPLQRRPRSPRHPPLPQAHNRRPQRLRRRRRHNHDAPHEHPDRVLWLKNRLRVRAARARHGSVLLLLPAAPDRALARHARRHHRRHVPGQRLLCVGRTLR